jgi:hypothetical protein
VPGAKFLARTTKGPEPVPLIEIPFPVILLFTCTSFPALISASMRSSRVRRIPPDRAGRAARVDEAAAERAAARGLNFGFDDVDAERYKKKEASC